MVLLLLLHASRYCCYMLLPHV
eukprot:SAG11_NODE_20979_length_434_cov_1.229851_1_plen_21_part_01